MREGYTKSAGPLVPTNFGEIDLCFIKFNASGRVAADSAPDTTVGAGASGAYACTFPKSVKGWVLARSLVKTASDGIMVEVTAFDAQAGTITVELSDEANLTGAEEVHLLIALGRKE